MPASSITAKPLLQRSELIQAKLSPVALRRNRQCIGCPPSSCWFSCRRRSLPPALLARAAFTCRRLVPEGGPGGLIDRLRAGQVLIDMSTSQPALAREIAAAAARRGAPPTCWRGERARPGGERARFRWGSGRGAAPRLGLGPARG